MKDPSAVWTNRWVDFCVCLLRREPWGACVSACVVAGLMEEGTEQCMLCAEPVWWSALEQLTDYPVASASLPDVDCRLVKPGFPEMLRCYRQVSRALRADRKV